MSAATDELQYLMDFNISITQAMGKTMEHLSDFVFLSMANLTLARQDSYLYHLKTGIKPDTLAALRSLPLQMAMLFQDNVLKLTEEKTLLASKARDILIPAHLTRRVATNVMKGRKKRLDNNKTCRLGRTWVDMVKERNTRARHLTTHHDLPRTIIV